MTDSVRCRLDSNRTFTCDVHMDSDTENTGAAARAAPSPSPSAPPSPAPAVSSLVHAYSKTRVAPADAPVVSAASLSQCASAELAMPLAFATSGAVLAPLAGFKAGYDMGQCLAAAQQDAIVKATEHKGAESCEADGGRVTAIVDHRVMCDMTGVAQ